jgi:hypothetical protein
MAKELLSLTHRIATWLVRWRSMLLTVLLLLTVAGVWPSNRLRFDVAISLARIVVVWHGHEHVDLAKSYDRAPSWQ